MSNGLEKRQSQCHNQPDAYAAHTNAVWGCYYYLNNLETTACTVPGNAWINMCRATYDEVPGYWGLHRHIADVDGHGQCGGSASSYSMHVANAVNSIIGWCTDCRSRNIPGSSYRENYCSATGLEAAYGNGCFAVLVAGGSNWNNQ